MDSLIKGIADAIEEVADEYVETGCSIRDIYAVLMLVSGEVGHKMKERALNKRLKRR